MVLSEQTWQEIDERWADIRIALLKHFDLNDYRCYNDDGDLVESGRPMIESIIDDRRFRNPRFLFYLMILKEPDPVELTPSGGRIIHVGCHSHVPFRTGGSKRVDSVQPANR